MTEDTNPTPKKKRGRPTGSKQTSPKKPRTEAQIAAQFKPGNQANKEGWSMRKEIRAYRKKMDSILSREDVTKALIDMYCMLAEEGRFREWMELNRFMAEYAYGKPKDMLETEEEVKVHSEGNNFLQPVIGLLPSQFDDAEESEAEFNQTN